MRLVLGVILARWRLIAAVSVGGALLLGIALLLRPRRYEATVTVASVTSRTGLSGAGLAATFLGTPTLGGVQSTPAFVTRLARLDGVLLHVGQLPVGGATRLIDSLEGKGAGAVSPHRLLRKMRELTSVRADLQTGLVTITMRHRDSALVRRAIGGVLEAAEEAFINASRAQASMLRRAQDLRVDSAQKRLTVAEERLRQFLGSNRVVAPYSEASVVRQRLERELRLAETVHSQAVTDRENAVAKELEETPALVIVDPLPAQLRPAPRGIVVRVALTGIVLVVLASGVLVALEALVRSKQQGDAGATLLWRQLKGDSWLRWYRRTEEPSDARLG